MKNVKLNNKRLMTQLSNITEMFFTDDVKKAVETTPERTDKLIPDLHACSEEYLFEAFKKPIPAFGYPRGVWGLGMKEETRHPAFEAIAEPIRKKVNRLGQFLGTPNNALLMAYPDNGYIGWHHNGNASGYNVLLTYSQDGDGNFSYWDYGTKSIKVLQDVPGWQVRVGFYPHQDKQRDKVFWHMAETKKQRITLAWVINHKPMWESMINEISLGDYDPSILET